MAPPSLTRRIFPRLRFANTYIAQKQIPKSVLFNCLAPKKRFPFGKLIENAYFF